MPFVLALDQGTTSSRAIVFDQGGGVRGAAQAEFRQIFPQPGWVEHDAMEIWATQSGVMHEALVKAGVAPREVVAVGITNQRETTVLWERATGRPIANAIVWQDRRTAPMCDELRAAGHAPTFAAKTGLVLDAYFSGTKLRWLLDNVPGARARAARGELAFGTIDAWLIWQLTGGAVHATDPSNASRTLLFDIHKGEWDDELLRLLDVPREVLPSIVSSSGVCGETRIDGVRVPIAGIAGDQQAALFGQACLDAGLAKNTYGTGCFLLLNTGAKAVASRNNLLTTVAWKRDGRLDYALEGSVFIGGAVVQWLRDGLQIIRHASEVEALARSVPDNGGVFLVPAFAGLGAPHWDAYARGAIFGLTRGATGAHLARAALEAIALSSADVLDAMQKDAGITLSELRVDGGATANDLLDADPGRRARRSGRAAQGAGDDGARRRVSRGARDRLLAQRRRPARQLEGRPPLRADAAARARGGAARRVGEGGGTDEGVGVAVAPAALRRTRCSRRATRSRTAVTPTRRWRGTRRRARACPDHPRVPLNVGQRVARARPSRRRGDHADSRRSSAPANAAARFNLGSLYVAQSKLDAAESAFRAALDLDPTMAEAAVALAAVLDARGRSAEAEQALKRAIAQRPDYAGARFNLAQLYDRQHRCDEAEAMLASIDHGALRARARCWGAGRDLSQDGPPRAGEPGFPGSDARGSCRRRHRERAVVLAQLPQRFEPRRRVSRTRADRRVDRRSGRTALYVVERAVDRRTASSDRLRVGRLHPAPGRAIPCAGARTSRSRQPSTFTVSRITPRPTTSRASSGTTPRIGTSSPVTTTATVARPHSRIWESTSSSTFPDTRRAIGSACSRVAQRRCRRLGSGT